MKPVTIAAAALTVFFLAMSMMISAPAAAPATTLDRCLACHPKAHPVNWTQKLHVTDLESGQVTESECAQCHTAQECVTCHAQVKTAQQSGAAGAQQPAATTP